MPTQSIVNYSSPATLRLDPCYSPDDAEEMNVKLADGVYLRGTVLGELIGNNEVQTVTVDATSGTFTLTYSGQTTAAIAYNATALVVQQRLEALSNVGKGGVAVTGSAGGPYSVTFQGKLGFANVAQMTADSTSLAGNTHTASIVTATAGSAGTLGTFAAYAYDATDGSQNPRLILRYGCTVASGVVTLLNDYGQQQVNAVPAFMRGYFRLEELVGLDDNAVSKLGGRIVEGTQAAGGVFKF